MEAKFIETNNAPQLLLSHEELLALQLGGIDDKKNHLFCGERADGKAKRKINALPPF